MAGSQSPPAPAGCTLRTAEPAELDSLGRPYHRSHPPGVAGADADEAVADIAAAGAGEYGKLWVDASPVVLIDDELAGGVQVVRRAPWPDTPDCPFVIELFVAREHRPSGLARLLLHRAMSVVAAAGAAKLALRVDDDNAPAWALYACLGLREWVPST